MGLYKAQKVRKMTDDKIISLRMGTEEIQAMDDFLEGHPELGGRSLFIRTAIRQYIDRDADVPVTSNKNTVEVRLSAAELETIDSMIDDGTYIDRADAIRNMMRSIMVNEAKIGELAKSKYEAATTSLR
ncbi:MAG: hypothetical protein J5673_03755 [Candidatus Methanomethylophilaceae archaeon]|nr:hypothetical protein [Candidatus Methanomethylophilaceae archaeon]